MAGDDFIKAPDPVAETVGIIDNQNNDDMFGVGPVPAHAHNGTDSNRVSFLDLYNRQLYLTHTLIGTQPQTAGNYSHFFIAPVAMVVTGIQEIHAVAGTDGAAVTLQVEKLTGTTAPASGTSILTTGLNLKGTANTLQAGVLSSTITSKQLAAGNRLGLVLTGTPTALTNVVVLVTLSF